MSRYLAAKYLAAHRKRKRDEEEEESKRKREEEKRKRKREEEDMEQEDDELEEIGAPRRPAKSTERVRAFRKRKKLMAQEVEARAGEDDFVTAANDATRINLEPVPGRSTDPVRFYSNPDPVQIPSGPRGGARADSGTVPGKYSKIHVEHNNRILKQCRNFIASGNVKFSPLLEH